MGTGPLALGYLGIFSSPELLLLSLPASPLPTQIPEAWLLLANVAVILILVPVKDHLIDPLLLRCKLLPSALQKMALGMFFGFTSIIVAGVWRLVFTQTLRGPALKTHGRRVKVTAWCTVVALSTQKDQDFKANLGYMRLSENKGKK